MSDITNTSAPTGAAALLSGAAATPALAATPSSTGTEGGTTASTPPAATTTDAWFSGLENETVRGIAETKGWKSPEDAILELHNLEKIIGADKAGNTLVIPGPNATAEELSAYYSKLGVPAEAKDYKLTPEGQQPTEFSNKAAEWCKEANIPTAAAQALAGKFNEYIANQQATEESAFVEQTQSELKAFQQTKNYNQDAETFRRTVRATGADEGILDAMERGIGFTKMKDFFVKLGQGLGEHTFAAGGQASPFGMTKEAAIVALDKFKTDPTLRQAYLNREGKAVEEWNRLNQIAYAS